MKHVLIAVACGAALAWPLAALSAGGGGDDGMSVRAQPQDPEYAAGLAAAKRKDWTEVVARMGEYVKRRPDDANGWNELGHALRLTGQVDVALEAYDKALKIDPKHRGVREYLGEAYLQKGDLARAEEQLKVLDGLCFFGCEEHRDLKRSITEYKMKGKPAS